MEEGGNPAVDIVVMTATHTLLAVCSQKNISTLDIGNPRKSIPNPRLKPNSCQVSKRFKTSKTRLRNLKKLFNRGTLGSNEVEKRIP